MLFTTTDTIPGAYEPLGLVAAYAGTKGSFASFNVVVRRKMPSAMQQLEEQARALGGDAVFGLRFTYAAGVMHVAGTAIRRA